MLFSLSVGELPLAGPLVISVAQVSSFTLNIYKLSTNRWSDMIITVGIIVRGKS